MTCAEALERSKEWRDGFGVSKPDVFLHASPCAFFPKQKTGCKKQGFAFGNKRGNFLCLHMSVYPYMNDLERTSHIALRRLKSGLISFWRRVADSNMALVKEYRVAQGLENKEKSLIFLSTRTRYPGHGTFSYLKREQRQRERQQQRQLRRGLLQR